MRADRVIMTKQLQGEIRLAGWSGAGDGDWAYAPWMPLRGDKATAGVEVLALEGGANLTWEAQTRTMESGSPVDTTIAATLVSSTGVSTVTSTSVPAKELVRYRFKVAGSDSVAAYVIFRALQPSWQVNR